MNYRGGILHKGVPPFSSYEPREEDIYMSALW